MWDRSGWWLALLVAFACSVPFAFSRRIAWFSVLNGSIAKPRHAVSGSTLRWCGGGLFAPHAPGSRSQFALLAFPTAWWVELARFLGALVGYPCVPRFRRPTVRRRLCAFGDCGLGLSLFPFAFGGGGRRRSPFPRVAGNGQGRNALAAGGYQKNSPVRCWSDRGVTTPGWSREGRARLSTERPSSMR